MTTAPVITHIDRASFSFWNKDDIKKISVKKITEPKSFEKAGAMHPEGLYSPALGPAKRFDLCQTCELNSFSCPGHYGHIELSAPVYHPMLVQVIYQILSKCCLQCFHFRLSQPLLKLYLAQLEALNCGFDHLIDELDEIATDMCKDGNDGDSYVHVALGKKLIARIEEEKEKTPEFDCQKRPQQRSIVERVSKLFRGFINGQLIKPMKICPYCHAKKSTLTLHHQAVLILGTVSKTTIEETSNKKRQPKSKKTHSKKVVEDIRIEDKESGDLHFLKTDETKYLTPIGARHYMRQLWKNEKRNMQRIFRFLNLEEIKIEALGSSQEAASDDPKEKLKLQNQFQPVDLFFIDTILVPPSKFRPPMSQRGYSFEGPRTAALSSVMKQSVVVQDLIDRMISESDEIEAEMLQPKLQSSWKELQNCVNNLYDNEMDKYGKRQYPGLKQLIDKKEGLFRKNMMGKRVNFAARSVISPDPNILVDQIGVPLVFAKKLTYPQPVTPFNIEQLKEAVLNGPDKYPGATSIVYDDGMTVSLAKEGVRQAIAARLSYNPRTNRRNVRQDTHMSTIVNRHLLTGDVLLFNRQPTLHKPSIMAFRARVLPNEKGFRLHYANCKSFNADFDGDEMNAHLPQSELARSEAYNIASVNYQYLVPKDGSPLGGLIQDHVVAVCIMTRRDQFFDKEKYQQLVYCALEFLDKPLKLEQPTIVKPKELWTGKQVITTMIKNCIPPGRPCPTLNIKSKIGPKILNIKPEYEDLSDCHVIIRNGELLVGFMDKSNVGATQYGLVHTCYELYGGETSSALMSAFARLSTWYLQYYEGFTLGIADILVEDDANEDRQSSIEASKVVGPDSAKEALGITDDVADEELEEKLREAHSDRNPLPMKKLDAAMKTRTDKYASQISGRCLPEGLIRRFPDNNLQMMIQSGAKGGTVNALQISCLLGQIELEGRRVPLSMSGRSLPSFKPYDTSPKAGGFVSGRFLTGIQPQEFFFHCMAGREGLIDTAVKTSRSGYLQRCLIKHLEGLTVQYDQTVRDSCGSVIQFLYGEDGLDITRSQMLKNKAFSSLIENHKIIAPSDDEMSKLNKAKENYEDEVIARTNEIQLWLEKNGDNRIRKLRGSGFLDFLTSKLAEVKHEIAADSSRTKTTSCGSPVDHPNKTEEEQIDNDEEKQEKKLKVKKEETKEEVDSPVDMDMDTTTTETKIADISATGSGGDKSSSIIGSHHHDQVFESWYALSFKEKKKWNKEWELCPDPLISILNPASHFGVVPEKLDEIIEAFVKKNPQLVVDSATLFSDGMGAAEETNNANGGSANEVANLGTFIACDENPELSKSILTHWNQSILASCGKKPKLTKHEFYNLCYNLYMKMLAQPGEAVGLLAAQSIGEPSTQMTLNTFHFAGRGEMNVTLGIPRLREILMTASAKIGTPSMDLPLLKVMRNELGEELDEQSVEEQAKRVKLALNAVRLSDVLEYVDVTEQVIRHSFGAPVVEGSGRSSRKRPLNRKSSAKLETDQSVRYEITFALLPSKYYKHEFKSSSSQIMKFIEEVFVNHLIDSMLKRQKRLLLADDLYDLNKKMRNKTTIGGGGGGNGADANGGAGGEQEDPEEQDLDNYNAKAKAKEKVKEDESSSEEEEDGEGDNTTQRLRSRRDPELDYEEPEDDDLEVTGGDARAAADEEGDKEELVDADEDDEEESQLAGSSKSTATGKAPTGASSADKMTPDGEGVEDEDKKPAGQSCELADLLSGGGGGFEDDDSQEPLRKKKRVDKSSSKKKSSKFDEATIENRVQQVKMKPYVLDYSFDTRHEHWCKLTLCVDLTTTRLDMGALIEAEAKRTYVHRVGNIQRALIVKDVDAKSRGAKCDKMIKTEGVSLLSLVRFNHILDLNAIYTNDIHAIANTYGIEAASQAIRREMANVFAVYGIEVDPRHLSLIADYMTYNGSIRGMNRMSMEASASPFQQMSYESTIRYLKWAAILGLYDDIKSPSAALVFGRPTRGGTGLFATLSDTKAVANSRRGDETRSAAATTSSSKVKPEVKEEEDDDQVPLTYDFSEVW